MKFHWFHLMPYDDLPEFGGPGQYSGVYVDLPAKEVYDPVRGHGLYNTYLDELEYADQLGYDGICVNEHHQNGYGTMPSPNIMAASLTRRTRNAKLVVMGNSVALYNPPIRVAEEMAMLDVISGGRLVSGFPVGTPMDTVYGYGENPATLREKYYEGVELILKAWKSDKPFAFNGKYTKLRYINPWPRPIQQPHPPVWIPGGGSIETGEWCARNDFLYAYLSFFGYQRARETMEGYWEAVDRIGVDHNPYRAGFMQFIACADSDEEAERLYSEAALYFFNRCLNIHPRWFQAPGYTSIATMVKGMESQMRVAAEQRDPNLSWKDIVDRGYIVAGSPESVAQQIEELADTLNVGHLMLGMHYGNMSKETTMRNSKLFAEHVIPRLRDKFSDWDDRWWPKDTVPELAQPAPISVGA